MNELGERQQQPSTSLCRGTREAEKVQKLPKVTAFSRVVRSLPYALAGLVPAFPTVLMKMHMGQSVWPKICGVNLTLKASWGYWEASSSGHHGIMASLQGHCSCYAKFSMEGRPFSRDPEVEQIPVWEFSQAQFR